MAETFLITLQQMAMLMIFTAIGFYFSKRKKLSDNASSVISKLCVNIFVPALSFSTMADCCTVENLKKDKWMLLTGFAALIAAWLIAELTAIPLVKNKESKGIYLYAMMCPNYGYIGYPLIQALLGEMGLFDFMIWTMPFFIFTYTIAIEILKPNGKFTIKGLLNPAPICMALGMICGLTGITKYLPDFVTGFVGAAGNCLSPLGMIMVGLVLGKLEIKKLFNDARTYIISAVRLLGLPLLGIAAFYLAGLQGNNAIMGVIFLCLSCGLNTIIFPEAYGGDSVFGARIVLLTNLGGIISIPLIVSLAMHIFG